jgi:hypothetical protein
LVFGSINAGAGGGPLLKPLGNGGGGGGGGGALVGFDMEEFNGGAGGILLLFLFVELSA